MSNWRYLLRACTSPLKAASRTFMIWYPCRGAEMFWTSARTNVEQRRRTNLWLSLPLPVGQNLPERRPDVETVQLKRWNQLLRRPQWSSEMFAGAGELPCHTWQKWTALQGFLQASNSGENAIRPRTPGTTASREPWLLDTAGMHVCNGSKLSSDQILLNDSKFGSTTKVDSIAPPTNDYYH